MDKYEKIAEFVGWKYSPEGKQPNAWFDEKGLRKTFADRSPMQFEYDWNELIPAIKKCNKIYVELVEKDISQLKTMPRINTRIKNAVLENNIGEAFDCVVEFVEWYNENIKN